jgi:hypothetical protein
MGKLLMGILFGTLAVAALSLVFGPVIMRARNRGPDTEPEEGAAANDPLRNVQNELKGFWRDIKERLDEAVAAGKEAARETEVELRRRYHESMNQPRQQRRR